MANRELPELRSRLRLDTTEAEARAKASARRIIAAFDDPKAMEGLSGRLETFSGKADRFGSVMTRGVTLPVVAAGAASFKMASDFNTSFTQMQTLAGVTSEEVDGLKSSVMDLSGTTAQSPQELARALYFIRSAGLEGADALSVLEVSAKGSAIGLGETAGVADVLTSALNTYGSAELSAARAGDILAAAVAVGKGEAADFAPQLGNLLPIAQGLGVGFDQVAGSVAFLTQTNGDVARSATMVGGVLQKLQAPSESAAKVLESVGLSGEKLRDVVERDGLVAALRMLDEKLGGNREQLRKVFDDVEGFNGVLGLLRSDGGAAAIATLDQVANSAGYVDNAFQKVNETDEFKFQQALADLQATAVQVGQDLIPVLTQLVGGISDVVNVFAGLPDPVRRGLIVVAAMAAALGPLAKGASAAASGMKLLVDASASGSLSSAAAGLGSVKTGAFAAAAGLTAYNVAYAALESAASSDVDIAALGKDLALLGKGATDSQPVLDQYGGTTEELAGKIRVLADAMDNSGWENLTKGSNTAYGNTNKLKNELGDLDAALASLAEQSPAQAKAAFDQLVSSELGVKLSTEDLIAVFPGYYDALERSAAGSKAAGTEASTSAAGFTEQADAVDESAKAFEDAIDQARALFDARQEVQSTAEDVTAAEGDLADAHQETADRERAAAEASRAAGDARRAAAQADREAAEAARAIGVARTEGARAVRDADLAVTAAERDQAIAIAATRLEQEGLTQARKDAVRSLEDLQRSNRGDVLSEKEARLALKEAQRDLRRAKPSEREGAALRVERAQLALESAIVRAQDSTAELATRRAAGVEGSPEVIAQQDRITAAQRAEEEAGQRLTAAQEAAADARVAAADRVRDAQDRLASAQDRQREAGERIVAARAAVVEAHDAITEAAGREKEAADKVTTAEGLHVEAQGELAGLLFGNAGKIDVLVRKYSEQANALDPNSPLRKNLEAYISDLQRALDLETVRQTIGSGPGGGIPPTRDPDRGAGPGRSSFPGGKATPKLTVPNVTGRTAPRLAPAAAGSALPPIQVGPFYIDGNPDESALRQLERIAERAVESGLRKVATR